MELKRLWRKRGFLLKPICCFADKASAGGVAGHLSGLTGKGKNPPQPSPDAFSSGKVASLAPPASTTNILKSTSGSSLGILRDFNNLKRLFQRIFEIVIFFPPFQCSCTSGHPRSCTAACTVASFPPCILTAFSSPSIDFSARSS